MKTTPELRRARQETLLNEALRLVREHKNKEASTLLKEVVTAETDSPEVLRLADSLWARSHPSAWAALGHGLLAPLEKVAASLPYLALAVFVVFTSWFVRKLWPGQADKWVVGEIVDTTTLNMAMLVSSALDRWTRQPAQSVTTGLLLYEASKLPQAPSLSLEEGKYDLVKAIESKQLKLGQVDVGALAGVAGVLRKWWNAQKWAIEGHACEMGSRLVVRLQARGPDRVTIVSASSAADAGGDAAASTADRVGFKMLYSIAKNCDAPTSDLADEIRRGLSLLDEFVSEGRRDALSEAHAAFKKVRVATLGESTADLLEQAHLFEGVALDLLEQHEEAAAHFHFVKEIARSSEMRQRAAYNEATAHLRNLYQLPELERAIGLIDTLVAYDPLEPEAAPIKAMALALKAIAIAHLPLHWQRISQGECPGVASPAGQSLLPEENLHAIIDDAVRRVGAIIAPLRTIASPDRPLARGQQSASAASASWDGLARTQLRWAIHDAEGNVHLNAAIALRESGYTIDLAALESHLQQSLASFRECEMLLPAGVETLSNLGTVFLMMGRFSEARAQLDQAIKINPDYEYAYLRVAQTWERESRQEKAVAVLRSFPRPPRIHTFKKMFQRYFVQPVEE